MSNFAKQLRPNAEWSPPFETSLGTAQVKMKAGTVYVRLIGSDIVATHCLSRDLVPEGLLVCNEGETLANGATLICDFSILATIPKTLSEDEGDADFKVTEVRFIEPSDPGTYCRIQEDRGEMGYAIGTTLVLVAQNEAGEFIEVQCRPDDKATEGPASSERSPIAMFDRMGRYARLAATMAET